MSARGTASAAPTQVTRSGESQPWARCGQQTGQQVARPLPWKDARTDATDSEGESAETGIVGLPDDEVGRDYTRIGGGLQEGHEAGPA
ncbi:hypothetical protein [Candidatus Amarolinea dominans]|uniref:hypothetical protein n=1 Tax=Candidatus Amarolinea dominans TaxID=3140696 RepID=UPI0031365EB9|nr:hypothetical protein [Anaerolineae bacterium]